MVYELELTKANRLELSRGFHNHEREVSIYVKEAYRQKGVATALGSKLLLECLNRNERPNWDAANPESCKLAKKLGYTFVETYDAYYHTGVAKRMG